VSTPRDDFEVVDVVDQGLTFTLEMVFLRDQREVSINHTFYCFTPRLLGSVWLGSGVGPVVNQFSLWTPLRFG
jgi:hypothetical protein